MKIKQMKVQESEEQGVTLVALVVTIVIMLILAGVALNIALGDNGLINQTKKATEKYKEAQTNDEDSIKDLEEQMNNIINGGEKVDSPITIEEAIEKGEDFAKDENKDVVDEFGNPVTIPAGFYIVTHEKDETVDYHYSDTKNGIPTVQDGIVIQDKEGNQFVWIPVSTNGRKIKDKDNEEIEIKLARRIFKSDGSVDIELTNGTALTDGSYEYTEDSNNNGTGKSDKGNAIAKNIEEFKTSANKKGGYYLARYEAGITNYKKDDITTNNAESEINWTGYKEEEGKELKLLSKKDQQVWNTITQLKASEVAQKMYTSGKFTSDLVNSYAWDTAVLFIQKYSEYTNYSWENGRTFSKKLRNTGAGIGVEGDKIDKVCNIYDMASNCLEWITETSSINERPCALLGGTWTHDDRYTVLHGNCLSTFYVNTDVSFRVTMYIK